MTVFLAEAVAIADTLCRDAVHHHDRCTWITRAVPYRSSDRAERFPELMALNPSVYSGTAGIAVYLARVARLSESATHRRTARAAMNHALAHATWHDPSNDVGELGGQWRYGFYLGTLGIAWAACEVGQLLDEPYLLRASRRLVASLSPVPDAVPDDVMFGAAGGVPALLSLAAADVPGASELAVSLGDRLLAAARPGPVPEALSWGHDSPALTGFSHGTAGVAHALSLLSSVTGSPSYAAAAAGALAYERHHFDAAEGNWPHFQSTPDASGRYSCSTSWCHGAPGIGLSRTRLLSYDGALDELAIAAATTAACLEDEQDAPGRDQMLCHGVLGLAECLWEMSSALGAADALPSARALASAAIDRYGTAAQARWGVSVAWPTGVAAGTYPPLVTGVAGVGHFLLRLHDPVAVPSMLLPGELSPAA